MAPVIVLPLRFVVILMVKILQWVDIAYYTKCACIYLLGMLILLILGVILYMWITYTSVLLLLGILRVLMIPA